MRPAPCSRTGEGESQGRRTGVGRSECRSVGRRTREVSQSQSQQLAVAVTVRSRSGRRDRNCNCKARRCCGSTYTRDRAGTGTRVQAQAQTQAQGRRVGHRILAVWDETRLYEVRRACKRVAVGGVVCCSYPWTYMRVAYGSARLIGDLVGGEGRGEEKREGGQMYRRCCCRWLAARAGL